MGCRLPHHGSRADCQKPCHSDAHPRGDRPTQSIRPRGVTIRRHGRRVRAAKPLPRRLEKSLSGHPGQSSGSKGDHLPAEPLAYRHTVTLPVLNLGDTINPRTQIQATTDTNSAS
jgi:hypothetical protein